MPVVPDTCRDLLWIGPSGSQPTVPDSHSLPDTVQRLALPVAGDSGHLSILRTRLGGPVFRTTPADLPGRSPKGLVAPDTGGGHRPGWWGVRGGGQIFRTRFLSRIPDRVLRPEIPDNPFPDTFRTLLSSQSPQAAQITEVLSSPIVSVFHCGVLGTTPLYQVRL